MLTGAIRYYDAQVDDARLTMMLARTAVQHGATVLTRVEAVEVRRDGRELTGVRVHDLLSGGEQVVHARRVISAAGVWTEEFGALDAEPSFRVRMSKGVHILVPRSRIRLDVGLITRTEKSVLFVIPWHEHWIIGTTDTPWDHDPARPTATRADVEYLLDHVNSVLRDPLTAADVVGVYAGLRPLLDAGAASDTTKLSREHAVAEPAPGFFVVAGGKYTTYRIMAADVVDAAAAGLGRAVAPSLTRHLPIHGAVGFRELWAERERLAPGLPAATVERLLGRYGSAVNDLLAMIAQQPRLAEPLAGAPGYLAVEAVYAVTHEGALDLDDVLSRRTRIAMEYPEFGLAAAEEVAALVAGPLGWSDADRASALGAYREQVAGELAALAAPDDASAMSRLTV
jgi:glycerol-3-phosphate dehydrogenase